MDNKTTEKSFTPKYEIGTKVYIVDEQNRDIIEGKVIVARLVKSRRIDEYKNFSFDPPFLLKEHYDIEYWGNIWKMASKYEDEIFPTIEDAMIYLSKLILKKFNKNK